MPGDYRSRAESAGRRPAAGVGELSPGIVRALPQCCGYRQGHTPTPSPAQRRAGSRWGGRVYDSRPMSHTDELDEYDAELELRLKREYADVFPLFRYCVLTQEATYLCNSLGRQYEPQAAYPFFHVVMEDVWVWDKNRPTRIIPRVEIHTTQDVTVEVLRAGDDPADVVDEPLDLPPAG